MYLVRIIKL